MGGDGQALANKRSLLQKSRVYATSSELEKEGVNEKQTAKERIVERWTHCALSLEPLELPAAFDTEGSIYSKQSVINYLIKRKEAATVGDPDSEPELHIKKLSDVREIENDADDSDTLCCPVTGFVTSSGQHSFVGFWGCGHVVCTSTVPTYCGESSQVDVECPFCGEQSFYVRLVLDNAEEGQKQVALLRGHLKKLRKRQRE